MTLKKHYMGGDPRNFFFVLIAASNLPLTFALFEVRVQEEKFLQCIDTSLLRFNFLYLYVLRFHHFALAERDLALANWSIKFKVSTISHFAWTEKDPAIAKLTCRGKDLWRRGISPQREHCDGKTNMCV